MMGSTSYLILLCLLYSELSNFLVLFISSRKKGGSFKSFYRKFSPVLTRLFVVCWQARVKYVKFKD